MFGEEGGLHEVLPNRVHRLLHLKLLLLDAQVVSLVQRVKDFVSLDWCLCHILIDFRYLSIEDNADVLQLGQENLQHTHILL